jgi:hypothetical protein
MASTRGLGWLARGALLAAALIVPACSDGNKSGAKNPGNTSALWSSTSGSGTGTGKPTPGVLLWIDPNLAPVKGGTGGGLNLTYGQADPVAYPPANANAQSPLSVSAPQDATASNNESVLIGRGGADYGTAFGGAGGAGGGQIGQIGGGVNQGPGWYAPNVKLTATARGTAKFMATKGGAPPQPLLWRLQKVGVNAAMQMPTEWVASGAAMTPDQAYNSWGAGPLTYITGSANPLWAGGGTWSAGGTNFYSLIIIRLPRGQIP